MTDTPADVCRLEPECGPDSTSPQPTAAATTTTATHVDPCLEADAQADVCTEVEAALADLSEEARAAMAEHPLYATFCPRFHRGIELIGRRWTGAIVRAMLGGATRFSDIAGAVPGLSDRLLSERLRELEAAGVITRTVIPAIPVRVEYALTESGRALDPVIDAVAAWAETWVTWP